jgi:hypothetical protein
VLNYFTGSLQEKNIKKEGQKKSETQFSIFHPLLLILLDKNFSRQTKRKWTSLTLVDENMPLRLNTSV